MGKKIRWGILSTAAIGTKKVIPAMQRGQFSEVTAIASRSLDKAKAAASELGIATACTCISSPTCEAGAVS